MKRFEGQLAIVTGCSSGIGLSIVKKLLEQKINVVGLARNEEKLKELSDEIKENNSTYKGLFYYKKCDVSVVSEIKETLLWIEKNICPPSILINNAGVLKFPSSSMEITEDEIDITFNTNVKSVIIFTQEVSKSMIRNKIKGHIVNISSVAGIEQWRGLFKYTVYKASKTAVKVISKSFRDELAQYNIKVSTLYPGLILTNMTKFATSDKDETQIINANEVANACIMALATPYNTCISDLTVEPIIQDYYYHY